MAEIPSDIASSASQANIQARVIADNRGARNADTANAVNRQVKATEEADTTVDTADDNAKVFADAEGTGSQGRPFEEEGAPAEQEDTDALPHGGISRDETGRLHLDLEA